MLGRGAGAAAAPKESEGSTQAVRRAVSAAKSGAETLGVRGEQRDGADMGE